MISKKEDEWRGRLEKKDTEWSKKYEKRESELLKELAEKEATWNNKERELTEELLKQTNELRDTFKLAEGIRLVMFICCILFKKCFRNDHKFVFNPHHQIKVRCFLLSITKHNLLMASTKQIKSFLGSEIYGFR